MAAGSETVSGNSRGSGAVLESSLDRRFQGVSNTMESIQGLSTWCIENKKYHSVIVRSWLKWLRKSDASQRLNLFYLANDVIQNCKRRNAIVYRTTFTDVLPEAIKLISNVKDSKVRRSVDRILSIWEERNVYSEELINQLKGGLAQLEEPPAPANPKAALRSKIVAEFLPSAFIEHLTKYRNSVDEIELKEKQLAAMRVDVCSTVALKKLKDKAGGKRFSKDFEDGSAKLQDFVAFLDGEVKKGPALIEVLENADIFYEMQYKEVKIVTNAYQTFANRVLHLKKKLDAIKESLPDPDDSPIPSPSEDAPSPTGSESPFHGLTRIATPDPELDGQALEEDLIAIGDAPSPLSSPGDKDNRDVEDMDLSDVEELAEPAIIVEQRTEPPVPASVSSFSANEPSQTSQAAPEYETPAATTPPTTTSLPMNLAGVDLGKISSIISTLTNAMKNTATGANPGFRLTASTSSTLSSTSSTLKSPTVSSSPAVPASNSLAKILSRVDINPGTLLNVLSKTQTQGIGLQGLSSFLNSQTTVNLTPSASHLEPSPEPTHKAHASPITNPVPPAPTVVSNSTLESAGNLQSSQSPNTIQNRDLQKKAEEDNVKPVISVSSLDSKIDGFLQGNPALRGLNMGFPPVLPWTKAVDVPSTSTENLGGTPVRDESGATPTQDEVMDEPVVQPFSYQGGPVQTTSTTAPSTPAVVSGLPMSTYSKDSWQEQNRHVLQYSSGSQHSGDHYQRDFQRSGLPLNETGHHQRVESLLPSSMADTNQNSNKINDSSERISLAPRFSNTGADTARSANDGWYSGHGQEQRTSLNSDSYEVKQHQSEEHRHDPKPLHFFNTPLPPLPPIPKLPPPPQDFVPPVVGGVKDPTELTNISDSVRSAGNVPAYLSTNPVSHDDYDERLHANQIPAKETFHPRLNAPGPRHCAVAPHPVRLGPQNGPMDFNHRPRVPVHNQHPTGMPRLGPPSAVRGYHEANPSLALSEDPYLDSHCDAPPHSPSPPPYNVEHPVSPQTRPFYPDGRAAPRHHLEPRLCPRPEHRPPPPQHHYRPPRPGHFPPQRPLRRPPPPHIPHPSEPPFQRGKRHGPPFGGPPRPAGPFYPPKRPFLPPRY
ncbi:regulation of nuclear pre-mRNA domain-containing protein 2 [Silurus meridionalis]|nr:regulation of nuclear pre-mRNA domain-containing protein 2 [Silurus meridionalis]